MIADQPLIYPTLDLFLYDLRDSLGDSPQDIADHRKSFWEKVYAPPLSDQFLQERATLENSNADQIELLADKSRVLLFEPDQDGYVHPRQLGDTYSLHVDYSGPKSEGSTDQEVKAFQDLKTYVLKRLHCSPDMNPVSSVGHTWFAWAQLKDAYIPATQVDAIAQSCYASLCPHSPSWDRDFVGQGRLHGATLYEIWQSPTAWNSLDESFHLVLCLLPAQGDLKTFTDKIGETYLNLTRFFGYRHKILWAYWQSRLLKAHLKPKFAEVQNAIADVTQLPQKIKQGQLSLQRVQEQLAEILDILSTYAISLHYLDDQSRTIQVNLTNYRKRLLTFQNLDEACQLDCFEEFCYLAENKYLIQVQTDHANLLPGLMLLENLIRTLQGIIEIEQTKRDNRRNYTIAGVGTGLAVSQIANSVIVSQNNPAKQPNLPFFQTTAFLWSIGVTAIVGTIVGVLWIFVLRFVSNRN